MLFGGVGTLVLGSGVLVYENLAYDPRQAFERGYNLDLKSLPEIPFDEPKETLLSQSQINDAVQSLVPKLKPMLGGKGNIQVIYTGSEEQIFIRLEPDVNYANRLKKEAALSIDHLTSFINSPYVNNSLVTIAIPNSPNDIKTKGISGALMYIVSDVTDRIISDFLVKVNGVELYSHQLLANQELAGAMLYNLDFTRTENGFILTKNPASPIFYKQTESPLKNIETPALEFLHRCMNGYTIKSLEEEVRIFENNRRALKMIADRHMLREEQFVHAIGILWLKQYNKDRDFNFSEQDLEKHFAEYEKDPSTNIYRGAVELSRRIERVGVAKSIDMYVNNPKEF